MIVLLCVIAFVFANGCRAPPWRQVHGDIAYLLIKSTEGEEYSITASTIGYYVNKGMKQDGNIEYERDSDVFTSLILLLKAKSAHFANVINKKVATILFHFILYLIIVKWTS